MHLFSGDKVYDFMSQRRLFIGLSLVVTVAALVLLVMGKARLGTDFRGGTEVDVAFNGEVGADEVRRAVAAAGMSEPDVIKVDDPNAPSRWLIRVQEVNTVTEEQSAAFARAVCFAEVELPSGCTEEQRATEMRVSPGGDKISLRYRAMPDLGWLRERASAVPGLVLAEGANNPSAQNARDNKIEVRLKSRGDQLMDAMRTTIGADKVPSSPLRVEWIGPKAGKQLRDSAVKSVVVSLVFIMLYIAIRFDVRFAPGGVLSLTHDALGTLLVLILLKKEISLQTVAALLTIIGYSINDTVVIYDRIRENFPKMRGATFAHIINVSTSEMLGRTVLTNLTVLVSLLAFFVWGTGALKDFAFTLVVGMVFGTYSSVYVACPLTEWLDTKYFSKRKAAKAAPTPAPAR